MAPYGRSFCTGTKVVVAVVWIVPVHLQVRIVGVPVHVRDVTIRVTRAHVLPISFHYTNNLLQNYLRCLVQARWYFKPNLMRTSPYRNR